MNVEELKEVLSKADDNMTVSCEGPYIDDHRVSCYAQVDKKTKELVIYYNKF